MYIAVFVMEELAQHFCHKHEGTGGLLWFDLHIGEESPRLSPPHLPPPRGWLHPNPSLRSSSDASPSWRVTGFLWDILAFYKLFGLITDQ